MNSPCFLDSVVVLGELLTRDVRRQVPTKLRLDTLHDQWGVAEMGACVLAAVRLVK
jgi:hypothetical protein